MVKGEVLEVRDLDEAYDGNMTTRCLAWRWMRKNPLYDDAYNEIMTIRCQCGSV